MRILLINPPVYDFSCFDFWLKPLGLLYIASYLKNNGYQVELFDFMDRHSCYLQRKTKEKKFSTGNFPKTKVDKPPFLGVMNNPFFRYGIEREKLEKLLESNDYDFVFITSMMTYWYLGVSEVIKTVKEKQSSAKTVLGGVYARLMPEHAGKLNADFLFGGDISSFDLFCRDILNINISKKCGYQDIVPLYELYNDNKCAAILTQTGCNLKCSYCAVTSLNPNYEKFSAEYVIRQLDYLQSLEIEDVAVYDDAILFDKKQHFFPIAKAIAEKKYKLRFHFSNGLQAKYIDDETAEALKGINTGVIAISVESASDSLHRKLGGKTSLSDIDNAIDCLKRAGFKGNDLYAYMLLGTDAECIEDVIMTVDYLKKKRVRILLNELSPIPSTHVYAEKRRFLHDPILTNNSVYASLFRYDPETVQMVKDMVKRVNRELHGQ